MGTLSRQVDTPDWTRSRQHDFWNRYYVAENDPSPGTYRFRCCSRVERVSSILRGEENGLWGHTQHLASCPTLGCDEKYPLMDTLVEPDD